MKQKPQPEQEAKFLMRTLPKKLQQLIQDYPVGFYVVAEDSNYKLVTPGSIVYLYGYIGTGDVRVTLHVRHKKQDTIEEQKRLGAMCKQSAHEIKRIVESDLDAVINPMWLTKVDDKKYKT